MKTQISPPPIARLLLAVLMCLPICGSHAFAQESYAVFDKTTNTLTFKHDTNKPTGAFALNNGKNLPGWYKPYHDTNEDYQGYNANIIKKVVFDASFANARPTSCYKWFGGCRYLTTIEGIDYLNTENVTDMSDMFKDCEKLTTLDVSKFDTKNVTDMSYMFEWCCKLTTLDVSNFDTKNVTDMKYMFRVCEKLTTLDVSNFDTKNVTDMKDMFGSCDKLTTLDLSNFDTKNVTDMRCMFRNCKALTTLDLSSFNTKKVKKMGSMFEKCYKLTTIYTGEKFVTTACENDWENWYMFENCTNLVGAVPYDKSKVGKEMANYTTGYFTYKAPTETYAVFDEATNTLTFKHDTNKPDGAFALNDSKNLPNWYRTDSYGNNSLSIKKVVFDASFANARPTSCYGWFYRCKDLTIIEGIEYLNTQNVTNMGFMFYGCSALKTLDVSNFDTKNVTNMQSMFNGCSALTTIYASDKFVTTACESDGGMFVGCIHLVGAVPYDENNVDGDMANYTTGYFTYKAATGIDAPTVSDDTAAEYYDLQGRRLNAPQKGVNIVKRGKETTKVLVK